MTPTLVCDRYGHACDRWLVGSKSQEVPAKAVLQTTPHGEAPPVIAVNRSRLMGTGMCVRCSANITLHNLVVAGCRGGRTRSLGAGRYSWGGRPVPSRRGEIRSPAAAESLKWRRGLVAPAIGPSQQNLLHAGDRLSDPQPIAHRWHTRLPRRATSTNPKRK